MFPIMGEMGCRFNTKPKAMLSVLLTSLTVFPVAGHASVIGNTFDEITSGDKVTISLTNYYKSTHKYYKDKIEELDGFDDQYEWGQSVGLFYKTGKVRIGKTKLKVGTNLGYSHVFPLGDSYPGGYHQWKANEKILKSKNCQWTKPDGTGQYRCYGFEDYGKVPVANVQLNWRGGNMKLGDGFYTVGMISAADEDDALYASFRGMMLKQKYKNYQFDGAFVTGFMSGNEDKMGDLTGKANYYDTDPLKYDYLYTGRVKANHGKGKGYTMAYGEAKDYLRRYEARGYYTIDLSPQDSLYMQSVYYYNHAAGDLWQQELEKGHATFQSYASILSYELRYNHDAWSLMYGFSKINAPLDNPEKNGSFTYGFGNAKGTLKLPTTGGYNGFRRDGTEANVVSLSYDFRNFGQKALKLVYRYHWADSPVKDKNSGDVNFGSEYEHVVELKYVPKSGMFKGLNFNLKQSFYRPDDTIISKGPDDADNKGDRNTIKLLVGYSFNL